MSYPKIRPSDIDATTKEKDWKTYSYEYGIDNGLNENEARTFADTASYFIESGGIVATDNPHFKIHKIQFDILAAMPDIKALDTEEEQVKVLFDYIFIMFHDKAYKYAKKSERLDFRVTQKQLADFMSVPGKTKTDKLQALLESYYKI